MLSNFTANNLGSKLSTSGNYYVEGVIVEVLDQKNGVFLIDDGTGETFYFRLPKNAEGVAHASWEIKLTLGDKVKVYGKINKYSTNTAPNGQYWPAIQSGLVTILEQHAHIANGEPVCTKDTLCACGAVVAVAAGHIDADANGMCDNCNWDMNLVEVNIAIGTDPKYNGVRVDDEAGNALSWTWSNSGFDAVVSKGTSTYTLYTTAKDYMQFKKQNTLTIVNKDDVTVKYIVISVTNATYLGYLKTALEGQYEYTADETNFTATIQINSTEDIVIENKASSTIYVNGVSIVYAKKGAHVHEFTGNITTPATCTENGLKTFTCECGEGTYTEVIEALGHSFSEGVCSACGAEDPNYVPPCKHKDTGLDAKCDICGEYFVPASPFKLEMYQHSKGGTYYFKGSMSGYYFATTDMNSLDGAVDVYAEETDGGYYLYFLNGETKNYLYVLINGTYTNIKYGETKAVWAFNTTFGTFTTEVSGTTYYMGTYGTYVTISASKFSYVTESNVDVSQFVVRPVSLVDHACADFTEKTTAPTCTAQGYTTKTCTVCLVATKVDYVDALGHDLVDVEGLAATCTTAGYTAYKACSVCTYVEGKEEIEALGHTWTDATCTAPKTCSVCSATEGDALGHTWTDATCTAPKTCSVCSATEGDALGHTFVDGKCECGAEDPNYVPPHEHTFVEGKCECGETDPDYVAPETPDETPDETPVEPQPELNFFQKIWIAILNFFKKLFGLI